MTTTAAPTPLTPERAIADCRDLAQIAQMPPAAMAELLMAESMQRHDLRAYRIYTHAHAVLTAAAQTGEPA